MGHRHVFSSSQSFETDNDQSWNHLHAEPSFVHLARASVPENSSIATPAENTSIDTVHFPSNWNSAQGPNGYPHLNYNVEMQHCQPDASGPSHDIFLPPYAAGNFSMVPENYAHHASSSNYGGQTFTGPEGGFPEIAMGNGRGPYKRKSPSVPTVCERGSTSRHYGAGSSSDSSMSTDMWQEKPNPDSHHIAWDCPNFSSSYGSNNLSIVGGEGSLRNVRSRGALDLETNLARTHISNNLQQVSHTSNHTNDLLSSADLSGQNSDASTMEWNHIQPSSAAPDNNVFNHAANHFIVGSGNAGASSDIGGYHNDLLLGRNPVSQNLQGTSTQPTRGVRSNYAQRFAPTFRASSGNLQLGHAATSDDGLQFITGNHSSRHPRPFSAVGWRNSDRNGRPRILSERYQSFSVDTGLRDRLTSEGLMIMERAVLYGSRNMFDHHRDMRLDIDNMSYEELLALEERIGNVSTGLSDDLVSKCLMESIYYPHDLLLKEEGRCVICLEEYKSKENVGILRACKHEFHVDCIKKWLKVKNSCPICKAPALADNMKEKVT